MVRDRVGLPNQVDMDSLVAAVAHIHNLDGVTKAVGLIEGDKL